MSQFLSKKDIEGLRTHYESDNQWALRKAFIERHLEEYPKNRLLSLAQIFVNMNYLGCTYDEELMNKVKQMGAGICDRILPNRKRDLDRGFVDNSKKKMRRTMKGSNEGPTKNDAPETALKKGFVLLKAQLSLVERNADPIVAMNKVCSRLKMDWKLEEGNGGCVTFIINHVTIFEARFSNGVSSESKNNACAAALAAISHDDVEVKNMNGIYELWRGEVGPKQCYAVAASETFQKASNYLPSSGPPYKRLESALNTVKLSLTYSAEQGTGWEQKISLKAMDVVLAKAVLRKGECIKGREMEKKEELAENVIGLISRPNPRVELTDEGLTLMTPSL
ncbi:hypothetical protein AB6A40_002556 [Gnathostoma spinigerum]|uniref:XRN2-binding (XTBD) domain-containing protein n=1 Tax=Gnathostoma spinigerum TaxID=75299 RepID=A0ABD6EH13_9BILA